MANLLYFTLSLIALTSASAAQGQGHQITPQLTDYVVVKALTNGPAGAIVETGLPTVVEVGGVYTVAFPGAEGAGAGFSAIPTLYYWDTTMTSPLVAFAKDEVVTSIEVTNQPVFSGEIDSIEDGVPPAISRNGNIAQLVTLSSTSPSYSGQGIVRHTSPLVDDVVVANQGQSVNGETYTLRFFTRPVAIDLLGTVGFHASLLQGTASAGTGIFRNAALGIDKIAATGTPADGTMPSSTFNLVGGNSLSTRDQQWNSASRPAFFGLTSASGAGAMGTNGIWAETGTSVVAIALSGEQAWQLSVTDKWSTFESPAINDSGDVAFRACVNGTNCITEGIWARIGGFERILAMTGDKAPLPNGDDLMSTEEFVNFGKPVIDAQGRIAFWAETNSGAAQGIWIADGTGLSGIRRVARNGDVVRGTGATIDTISFLYYGIADTGQVAFKAELSDSSEALFVESEYHSLVKIARESESYLFPDNTSFTIGTVNFYPGSSAQGVGGLYGDPSTSTDVVALAYQLIEANSNNSTVVLTVVGP